MVQQDYTMMCCLQFLRASSLQTLANLLLPPKRRLSRRRRRPSRCRFRPGTVTSPCRDSSSPERQRRVAAVPEPRTLAETKVAYFEVAWTDRYSETESLSSRLCLPEASRRAPVFALWLEATAPRERGPYVFFPREARERVGAVVGDGRGGGEVRASCE